MHEKPMKEARKLHINGAVRFIKESVLIAALAGHSSYSNSCISSAVPCADAVLEAMTKAASSGAGIQSQTAKGANAPSYGKLDLKTGLMIGSSIAGCGMSMRLSEPCMADIVAALKAEFPDSKVAFVKAAPASGGKDVLTVCWD